MNIHSSQASLERTNSGSTSSSPVKLSVETDQSYSISQNYTNVNEMKLAELRGENHTISDEQLVKAIERAIKAMQGKTTNLEFSIHEKTKLIAVKIKDSESGEVIREIPPEKSLDFVAKLWEMAGIFVDEKR